MSFHGFPYFVESYFIKNLKTKQLESFLVHNPDFLKSNNVKVYIDALKKLKDNMLLKNPVRFRNNYILHCSRHQLLNHIYF